MINFSVVQIHFFCFSVQVTTWWWSESSCVLIGEEGLFIVLIEIISLVGRIWFIHLLFIHHLIALPVILNNPTVRLSSGGVYVLGIIYYWHCYQLCFHWRFKILIWCNYQLIFVYFHSRANLFVEIKVSYFHTITYYMCVHHYHGFMLYFSIYICFHLAY